MGEWPHPFCSLCGTLILNQGSLNTEPNSWDKSAWLHNAFAIEGPECLGEPVQASTHPDELFTWHPATGHTDHEFGWGHLTLLPSEQTVYPHSPQGNRGLAHVKPGQLYLGFHRSCASIARQFVRQTTTYPVKCFADIWVTLNARYSKGPSAAGGDYAPHIPCYSNRIEWWDYDPLHIPNLTERLLENLTSSLTDDLPKVSESEHALGDLPKKLVDEIISHILSESQSPPTTYNLPQPLWKEILVQIPFLWDLDVEQIKQFPDIPTDQHREWNWEKLVRTVACGPLREYRLGGENTEAEKHTPGVWDYSHVKLDVPPGLTNRRRIWQILEDVDPKELDILDEPDFIILDEHLDRFIRRTVKDGVDVEEPDSTCLDWASPPSPSVETGAPAGWNASADWQASGSAGPNSGW
ncbi:hypothetical protein FHETE_3814 [Fusarium heterosporum]|uniref:Uncharacterized protein n=1 Tax=Fusarium heterosporum TaxID=42747 RepID=A0A8H5WU77_FUSHE|nr:hypothetical protein FHETE_3814 [Fusarium heterosporum]